jgi:hypothetical protein
MGFCEAKVFFIGYGFLELVVRCCPLVNSKCNLKNDVTFDVWATGNPVYLGVGPHFRSKDRSVL